MRKSPITDKEGTHASHPRHPGPVRRPAGNGRAGRLSRAGRGGNGTPAREGGLDLHRPAARHRRAPLLRPQGVRPLDQRRGEGGEGPRLRCHRSGVLRHRDQRAGRRLPRPALSDRPADVTSTRTSARSSVSTTGPAIASTAITSSSQPPRRPKQARGPPRRVLSAPGYEGWPRQAGFRRSHLSSVRNVARSRAFGCTGQPSSVAIRVQADLPRSRSARRPWPRRRRGDATAARLGQCGDEGGLDVVAAVPEQRRPDGLAVELAR